MKKIFFPLCVFAFSNCFCQKQEIPFSFLYDSSYKWKYDKDSTYISADSGWVISFGSFPPDTIQAKILLYDINNNLKLVDGYVILDNMKIRYLNYMRKPFNKNYKVYSFKSIFD